jgi:hypothetical protein
MSSKFVPLCGVGYRIREAIEPAWSRESHYSSIVVMCAYVYINACVTTSFFVPLKSTLSPCRLDLVNSSWDNPPYLVALFWRTNVTISEKTSENSVTQCWYGERRFVMWSTLATACCLVFYSPTMHAIQKMQFEQHDGGLYYVEMYILSLKSWNRINNFSTSGNHITTSRFHPVFFLRLRRGPVLHFECW